MAPPLLWQFFLNLLTNRQHRFIIEWASADGGFRITDPAAVAREWGKRKRNPRMTYDKIARAIRFGYKRAGNRQMIEKGPGAYEYRFIPDVKSLIGYSSQEMYDLMSGFTPLHSEDIEATVNSPRPSNRRRAASTDGNNPARVSRPIERRRHSSFMGQVTAVELQVLERELERSREALFASLRYVA